MAIPEFRYTPISSEIIVALTKPLGLDDVFLRNTTRSDKFSQSGIQQSAFSFTDDVKEIQLTFLTSTERDNMLTMFDDHALKGKVFKFIPDKDSPSTFDNVLLLNTKIKFEREFAGTDFWKVTFSIRKEIT